MLNITNKKLIKVDRNEDRNVTGRIKRKNPQKNCKRDRSDSHKKIIKPAVKIAINPPLIIFFT